MRAPIRAMLVLLLLAAGTLSAHELRPAYLEIHEDHRDSARVFWKTPMRGEMRLSLSPEFSGRTQKLGPVETRVMNNVAVQTWRMKSIDPLRGQSVRIAGLEGTMTDALVRIEMYDGAIWTQRLTPDQPAAVIPKRVSQFVVTKVYFQFGMEHILFGIDHLLFVLALLLITRGRMMLVKTISAFTLSHSITLAMTTLGFVHLRSAPVEAAIALSIVFVAAEIVDGKRGRAGITAKAPWLVAFLFGLLHGFGFAGALSEIGLPYDNISLALLCFNLGVEAGQLIFVAAMLGITFVVAKVRTPFRPWMEFAPPYAIGSVAMFWVMQRIAAF